MREPLTLLLNRFSPFGALTENILDQCLGQLCHFGVSRNGYHWTESVCSGQRLDIQFQLAETLCLSLLLQGFPWRLGRMWIFRGSSLASGWTPPEHFQMPQILGATLAENNNRAIFGRSSLQSACGSQARQLSLAGCSMFFLCDFPSSEQLSSSWFQHPQPVAPEYGGVTFQV